MSIFSLILTAAILEELSQSLSLRYFISVSSVFDATSGSCVVEGRVVCWAEDWWPVIIHGAEIVQESANLILVGLDPDEAIVGVFSGICRHEKPHCHFEIFDFFILFWHSDDHYVNFANCVSTVLVGSVEASNVYRCESLPVLQLRMLEESFEPTPYIAVHTELDLILLQEEVGIRVSRDVSLT